ncbi:MAG TPA: nucleotidyltransferase domain-containing protein, partial [Planctomycetota bacterium]|nr:nucleotidyltransferase domain-containing protein [Planctomycetota bacterium]
MHTDDIARDRRLDDVLPSLVSSILHTLPKLHGIWLFGSFARGQATDDSDIDIAVLGPRAFDPVTIFDLGLKLGVLARRDVDLVDLRRASLVLKKEILTSGKLLIANQAEACEQFAADAMALYVAFRDE